MCLLASTARVSRADRSHRSQQEALCPRCVHKKTGLKKGRSGSGLRDCEKIPSHGVLARSGHSVGGIKCRVGKAQRSLKGVRLVKSSRGIRHGKLVH